MKRKREQLPSSSLQTTIRASFEENNRSRMKHQDILQELINQCNLLTIKMTDSLNTLNEYAIKSSNHSEIVDYIKSKGKLNLIILNYFNRY